MSNMILALELITSDGRVLELRRGDPDEVMAELFEAATISLGALGVITEMTLQCIDTFSIVKVKVCMWLSVPLFGMTGVNDGSNSSAFPPFHLICLFSVTV